MSYSIHLSISATTGDIDGVAIAIKDGADINQDNGEALHKAIQGDDTRMVQTLIALGANVNQQHERWGIPLARAAERGNVEIVSYLLDHGATQYDQAVDKATRSNRIAVLQALKGRGVDTTPTAAAITAALQVKYAAAVLYHMADGHELTEQQVLTAVYLDVRQVIDHLTTKTDYLPSQELYDSLMGSSFEWFLQAIAQRELNKTLRKFMLPKH